MKVKGFDSLARRVHELQTARGVAITLLAFAAVVVVTSAFFGFVDWGFSAWMPDGEIVVMALGFVILSRFYYQKNRFQEEFGERAYRSAFARYNILGLGIVFASIAHIGYMPGPEIPDMWWRIVLIALGYFLIAVGAVLWVRSVTTIGLDYLAMLYVYFPAESRLVDSEIYSVLSHPIYAAALYIGIGLALAHANWYALVVALILPIFLTGWIRLVEEKELIERFPDYVRYRKQVPAFWAKLRDVAKFYRFLVAGA